jgi:inosine-uridine nucleoside N-ribohydrolase
MLALTHEALDLRGVSTVACNQVRVAHPLASMV